MPGLTNESSKRVGAVVRQVERSTPGQTRQPRGGTFTRRFAIGKADADILKGDSGDVTIHEQGGTLGAEAATDEKVLSYARMGDVTAGKWCYLIWFGHFVEVFQTECPDEA